MGIKYEVCGVEVDQKTHNEYMEKTFKFADGTERKLQVVELWAKSKDFEENLPDIYAQANMIVNKVRSELYELAPVKTSGHKAIKGYFDDLNKVYQNAYEERTRLEKAFKDTETAVIGLRDKYGHQYASAAMVEAGDVLRKGLANLEDSYKKGVAEVREKMQERLGQIFNATPDKLDSNTMALLNTGICTVEELANLAEVNGKNPVMQRIILQHVGKYAEEAEKAHGHYSDSATKARNISMGLANRLNSADSFNDVFDSMAAWGSKVSSREFHLAETFNNRWGEEFAKKCEMVDSMDVYAS